MKTLKINNIVNEVSDCDAFIFSISFENRCMTVPEALLKANFKYIIVCYYEPSSSFAKFNFEKSKKLFSKNVCLLKMEKDNPLSNYNEICIKLKGENPSKVLLDISTFTREMILILIESFKGYLDIPFKLVYNSSKNYNSDADDKIWLSKGVRNIRPILGYSGLFSPQKRLMLISLVGFESERTQIIIDDMEPSLLYLGYANAKDSVSENIHKINKQNFLELKIINPNSKDFEFSCVDIGKTVDALANIIKENKKDYNISIIPMNNKISTLALVSIVHKYPEVRICYSTTNMYNINNYSESSDDIHIIESTEI